MTTDVLSVVGARPQFVKAAVVSQALARGGIRETLVHTGQHYDDNMSDVFFRELGLPGAAANLGIGGLSHGAMTGRIMESLESLLLESRPACVLVYGDTNSTVAAALAAVKLHIPVAHVEAGMRSFNRRMPEEINRVVTDHVAALHFVTGEEPRSHLEAEGVKSGVHVVGDVMRDACEQFLPMATKRGTLERLGLRSASFGLVTLHRPENTDHEPTLRALVDGLSAVSERIPLVLPIHPRTKSKMGAAGLTFPSSVSTIEPVGYLDMLALLAGCELVVTDSGGLQKEAFYVGRPCITAREETEWTETVALGWNTLVGSDPDSMLRAVVAALEIPPTESRDGVYGDGRAGERIANVLASELRSTSRYDD